MNYLESNTKIPWDDLRYIFGEIMCALSLKQLL
jgi:hypothetical protein